MTAGAINGYGCGHVERPSWCTACRWTIESLFAEPMPMPGPGPEKYVQLHEHETVTLADGRSVRLLWPVVAVVAEREGSRHG